MSCKEMYLEIIDIVFTRDGYGIKSTGARDNLKIAPM